MKKIILTTAILLSALSVKIASAQVHVSLGVNIGSQPAWGPVGYDYANYYYLPDIDTYYDVPTHQYVYYENNVWVHRRYLPVRYRNYNLYNGYKVVVNERNPWLRHSYYTTHYAGYRGRHDQVIIRNSRDVRYANYYRGGVHRTTYVHTVNRGGHFGGPGRGQVHYGNPGHGGFNRGHEGGFHGGGHGGGEHGGGHGHH